MEKIIYDKRVADYLDDLVYDLFKQDYFSYYENAENYLTKIVSFVSLNIHTFPHKSTPNPLLYLGSNYIFYKSNARTTWFIFFEHFDEHYFITGILNNHCEEARFIGTN
ncbi:hypothetical protein [Flavobacterium sp. SM2513]|uniref:hypothetical protein n=1 Tax=Flavobacterium sp. SM2513 TaxID=3424766 RepID=UPI003D7F2E89